MKNNFAIKDDLKYLETDYFKNYDPELASEIKRIQENKINFVHYTSASKLLSIIQEEAFWLSNTAHMNDLNEVNHGATTIRWWFSGIDSRGAEAYAFLSEHLCDLEESVEDFFVDYTDKLRYNSYIASFSEYPTQSPNEDGLLSMWRAYGGDHPVAVVLNNRPFLKHNNAFPTFFHPVSYLNTAAIEAKLDNLYSRFFMKINLSESTTKEKREYAIDLLHTLVITSLTTKHKGFSEEKEWRIIYDPINQERKEEELTLLFKNLEDLPLRYHKIPLKNQIDKDLIGVDVDEIIYKIIIGPSKFQQSIQYTLAHALYDKFMNKKLRNENPKKVWEDAFNLISLSSIPFRKK